MSKKRRSTRESYHIMGTIYTIEGRVAAEGMWMPIHTAVSFEAAQHWLEDTDLGLHSYRIVQVDRRVVWPGLGPEVPAY